MPRHLPPAYVDLLSLSKEIHLYQSILTLLHWDQETYMPPGAISARSEQIAELSSLIHELKSGRKFKGLLHKLLHLSSGKPRVKGLKREELLVLREWHTDYLKASKLPASFVKLFSQTTSEASQIWAMAKKSNNFKLFAPFLKKIIDLSKEKAAIVGYEAHPYDALLENYEPCFTVAKLTPLFERLEKELKGLLQKILAKKGEKTPYLSKKVDEKVQMELGHLLLSKLPLEESYSRLDVSSHPFSMAPHPHDSRITTRILPHSFMSNLFSVLHEAGHSLYEMGLPLPFWGTSLAEATSLSIHESQSRWWETLIGRSLPFWTFFYPELKKRLPALKNVSLEKFYRGINQVTPSFIRVEADEVTYCLHVILRFDIEKRLIEGSLQVADLPEAWNRKMQELFGITPPTDREGCLQDIHWSLGDFGYFPTYALGNLFAAHFFTAFGKKFPDWGGRVACGDFGFMRDWLKENIHSQGRRYNSEEFARKVVGRPMTEAAYCSYLKKKYGEIYDL